MDKPNVLWSDETKIQLYGHYDMRYVSGSESESGAFTPKHNVSTVKHSGGSIMLWGCLTASGTGVLHNGWNNEGGGLPPNSSTLPQINS